jgi:hypothetical protein
MPWLAVVATIHVDVGTEGGCSEEGGTDRRDPLVSGRARARRLAGGSYTAARAERRARARVCADRAGPHGGESGEGERRARASGPNGPKGRNGGTAGLLCVFFFFLEFLMPFLFYFL